MFVEHLQRWRKGETQRIGTVAMVMVAMRTVLAGGMLKELTNPGRIYIQRLLSDPRFLLGRNRCPRDRGLNKKDISNRG